MRLTVVAACLSLCLIGFATANDAHASIRKDTNIPAEGLGPALNALARDRNFQIVYVTEEVANLSTAGATGLFTTEEALKRLLIGTGLSYRYLDDKTVTILPVGSASAQNERAVPTTRENQDGDGSDAKEGKRSSSGDFRVAQVDQATAGAQGLAEKGKGGELTEIVVTAQRREERLQDVPMSVQVFSQDNLDQQGVRSIDDLTRVSPGVTFVRNGSAGISNFSDESSDISIRGIDSNAGAATTGVYLDDTPLMFRHIQYNAQPYPALFDVQRVEVLKGPQGTLFGSGSEGGAIRFITPEPSLTDYSGYARAEFGQIEHGGQNYDVGVAFGGPIIPDKLGFRVSVSFREDGGWVDRVNYSLPPSTVIGGATVYTQPPAVTGVTEKNANWHDTATFRAALKWQPVDGLSIDPSFYIQTLHINDTAAYWEDISDPANNVYRNGNLLRDPTTDPWYISAIKVAWQLPWATFNSNTSYFSRDSHSQPDYSQWVATNVFLNQYPSSPSSTEFADRKKTFTQEIRLSSVDSQAALQWTVGAFYSHDREEAPWSLSNQELAPTPIFEVLQQTNVDKQLAAFGELSYKLTDGVSLTGGLRYSRLDFSAQNQTGGLLNGGLTAYDVSGTDKPVTPRVVLKYQPDANSLYYVSAAKGFRAGAPNQPIPSETCGLQAPNVTSSDSVWQYEVGLKNSLFERRLEVSAAAYYLRWNNTIQLVYPACGFPFADNLGNAVGKGGEISGLWRPIDGFTLGLTAAYTDTVYRNVVPLNANGSPLVAVTSGDHLPASPINVDANVEYAWQISDKRPYARLDYQFATAQHSLTPQLDPADANSDPTLPGLPEIRVLSVRGGVRFNGLDISLFVQNALDFHTPTVVQRDLVTLPPVDFDTNYYGRGIAPRTFGLTTTYRF